jgi:hypothetical protein
METHSHPFVIVSPEVTTSMNVMYITSDILLGNVIISCVHYIKIRLFYSYFSATSSYRHS